ncbi:MAG: A/G-specific adenine glycosylase [Chloroflexi bacterium]|nr:A/G-specific adenine glycosylase [Chloroflexota bacterium]
MTNGKCIGLPIQQVQSALLDWFAANRRALPWRRTRDTYAILVAEFMLQQTQVDRVAPIYEQFLARFPTIALLAAATPGDVIRAWSGLGYNRRAVHLHRLAQAVVERFGGAIPSERQALRSLPGVGAYTAGAVLSIAFGQDEPALDTNVYRVLGRLLPAQPPARLTAAASDLLPAGRAGDWNQALMDLGATICTARRPRCLVCPLRDRCPSAGQTFSPAGARSQRGYLGTRRYYRGRLVEALRGVREPDGVAVRRLEERLVAEGVPAPEGGWQTIAAGLARDGLVRIREVGGEPYVVLP